MSELVARIYNLKTWAHTDGEFEDEQYMYDQYMILQRYCIVNGYVESRYTVQKLYIYFCGQTATKKNTCKTKTEKMNWLFKIARYISEHEQESINLKEFN